MNRMPIALLLAAWLALGVSPVRASSYDRAAASLAFIAQKDAPVASIPYNNLSFGVAGCGPASITNALIAVFGVTDPATAHAMAPEVLHLLSHGRDYKEAMVNISWFNRLFDPSMLANERDGSPVLSSLLMQRSGGLVLSDAPLHAEEMAEAARPLAPGAILTGRVTVRESWRELVSLMYALHEAGRDDARVTLAFAGVGKSDNGTPLRSGKGGHYLSVMLHVGSFFEDGSVYVIDSLPRALAGEPFGEGEPYAVAYGFTLDRASTPFNQTYDAARVRREVIRLSLSPEAQARLDSCPPDGEARITLHSELLAPLVLFGPCLLFVTL